MPVPFETIKLLGSRVLDAPHKEGYRDMWFSLTINIDNDAFQPDPRHEIISLLKDAIESVTRGETGTKQIQDINGNTVGTITWG